VEELEPLLALAPQALSVDYLIGEPGRRGRGLGAEMIRVTVARSWTELPEAEEVVVPVSAGNVASWRALEAAGFTRVAEGELEPDNPAADRAHVVYRCARP
jgi:aminoglycoside 6'-N-acetyltransferase